MCDNLRHVYWLSRSYLHDMVTPMFRRIYFSMWKGGTLVLELYGNKTQTKPVGKLYMISVLCPVQVLVKVENKGHNSDWTGIRYHDQRGQEKITGNMITVLTYSVYCLTKKKKYCLFQLLTQQTKLWMQKLSQSCSLSYKIKIHSV